MRCGEIYGNACTSANVCEAGAEQNAQVQHVEQGFCNEEQGACFTSSYATKATTPPPINETPKHTNKYFGNLFTPSKWSPESKVAAATAVFPPLGLALLFSGCFSSPPPYLCHDDSNCVSGGRQGECVSLTEGVAYCAFSDVTCPSGIRWDKSAGDSLSGRCVEGESRPLPDMGDGDGFAGTPDMGIVLSMIVFLSDRENDGSDYRSYNYTKNLWRVYSDGTGLSGLALLTSGDVLNRDASWSPDGTKILFSSNRNVDGTDGKGSGYNIWTVNADGTEPNILAPIFQGGNENASWFPDGKRILFCSGRNLDGSSKGGPLTWNIWVMNSDGTGLRALTALTAVGINSYEPRLSSDGTKVVFISDRDLDGSDKKGNTPNLWVINVDGTGLKHLTDLTIATETIGHPRLSPDGTKIVFVSNRKVDGFNPDKDNRTDNLWLIHSNGTGLKSLTAFKIDVKNDHPEWSPDGTKIIYSSTRNLDGSNTKGLGGYGIWEVNSDGTEHKLLAGHASGGVSNEAPEWAQGDDTIVFLSNRKLDGSNERNSNGNMNVWTMNANGTGLKAVTTSIRTDNREPHIRGSK